ncbi:MAG: GNAT family N-acetyltransferase [Planctomycetaceae bacterium]|nr:GNAT family N-acetyltransferase [Planctomycetaceae bacterium]
MDRWFPRIAIPMSWEQFRQLPQHPAYRYEYLEGRARLTARVRRYHALLSLPDRPTRAVEPGTGVILRPLTASDWNRMPQLFEVAFAGTPPFSLLEPQLRLSAAGDCVERTRAGEFGRNVDRASFVAECDGRVLAALFVTLLQAGDLERFDDPRWREPPPDDALQQKWGRPHLTWILTAPDASRRGLATALLDRASASLTELGYTELASTFLLGNEPSLLWHWRNGFRLLSYVGSPRRWRDR